jgi:V/A-type H+-transporting ATPase subunit C
LAKENEIRIIRIIMVGKINNMPTDSIRERLRDVYV